MTSKADTSIGMNEMESIDGKKVLVTGGAGFIGYSLCLALDGRGAETKVVDNLSSQGSLERMKKLNSHKIPTAVADIRHRRKITDLARDCDLIFHLAAMASVPLSIKRPAYDCQVNVIGTVNVFEAARSANAKVVFASSSAVYGNTTKIPTPEDHRLGPISFYGLTKVVDEYYCEAYHETYRLPVVSLRLFNVYGPEARMGVTYDFLRKLRKDNRRLEVIGDGEQKKDFVYVDDAVEAFLAAAQTPEADGEAYNVGSGESIKVKDLAKKTVDRLGLSGKTEIICGITPTWVGDVKYTQADLTKIKAELRWRPKVTHEKGLEQTIRWFESSHGRIAQ